MFFFFLKYATTNILLRQEKIEMIDNLPYNYYKLIGPFPFFSFYPPISTTSLSKST